MIEAYRNGDTEAVRALLEAGEDPSVDKSYGLRLASEYGYTGVVELLLADGRADPGADNNYAIEWASRYGRTDIVKLLLADGRADPCVFNNSAILWASQNGHTGVVRLLASDARVDLLEVRRENPEDLPPLLEVEVASHYRRLWRKAICCTLFARLGFQRWWEDHFTPGGRGFKRSRASFERALSGK